MSASKKGIDIKTQFKCRLNKLDIRSADTNSCSVSESDIHVYRTITLVSANRGEKTTFVSKSLY